MLNKDAHAFYSEASMVAKFFLLLYLCVLLFAVLYMCI